MTVADLIAELQRLPAHLPVGGDMAVPVADESASMLTYARERATVTRVEWQGRYVNLVCDGEPL